MSPANLQAKLSLCVLWRHIGTGEVQLHISAALFQAPVAQEAGWTPEPVWTLGDKSFPPAENRTTIPRMSRPQAIHYTDWITPVAAV